MPESPDLVVVVMDGTVGRTGALLLLLPPLLLLLLLLAAVEL